MSDHPDLLKPLVDYFEGPRPMDWDAVFGRRAPLHVEIGSGMGEMLFKNATAHPDINFIGVEQIWERIYRTFKRIHNHGVNPLGNVKILQADVRDGLERLFIPESIDAMYCLFPCPWPKKSHIKHRLFSNDFLRLANDRLKLGAMLKVVTDFEPYCGWIKEESKNTGFDVDTRKVFTEYDTKFERKWKSGGQTEFFEINCVKRKNASVFVKKDVLLKAYKAKNFDIDRFKFSDVTGEVSVVFKDVLFDERKQVALVHVVVAEGHLAQHVRVAVAKKDSSWLIKISDGQKFFPTPGISKAIECVYKSIVATC